MRAKTGIFDVLSSLRLVVPAEAYWSRGDPVGPYSEQHAWETNECILKAAGAVRRVNPTADSKRQELLNGLGLKQAKHHRWYVDRPQIVSHQLAGALSSSRGVWENIDLPGRLLHFVTLNPITWSVLICEDLARQEPAADLIRAVGPNLLIALLMDGPQMSSRWPARYAAVLAEDPGTSVLTLTSLGMAERSRPILGSAPVGSLRSGGMPSKARSRSRSIPTMMPAC